MHKNKTVIGTGVITLIIGIGIGYAGAGALARSTAPQFARGNFTAGSPGGAMRGGSANGGGFLSGTIVKEGQNTMTLNTRDGSSHVVFITPDTNVSKSVDGTIADVSVGSTVIISGTINSDGSVSANLIQMRPTPSPSATSQAQ